MGEADREQVRGTPAGPSPEIRPPPPPESPPVAAFTRPPRGNDPSAVRSEPAAEAPEKPPWIERTFGFSPGERRALLLLGLAGSLLLAWHARQRRPRPIEVEQGGGSSYTLRVNVNTDRVAELCLLPGIGEKKARGLVAWRKAHGPFRNLEDLARVPGIGPKILEEIRDRVVFGAQAAQPPNPPKNPE